MHLRTERRGAVAVLTLSRPPHNYFDAGLLRTLADALAEADEDRTIRVSVLASDQRSFCAGAEFGGAARPEPSAIYAQAKRLMTRTKPLVAAVRGAAIGGGMGLALAADMRVGCADTVFHANFARLGICAGFGLSHTLPRLVGAQKARDLLLTARRVTGEEALAIGLLDRLVAPADVGQEAAGLASEIAANAPAAVAATRALLGADERRAYEDAIERELAQQAPLFASRDFQEGVRAARERRLPAFGDLERNHP